ncbi:hypothetical protein ACQCSX_09050 [Pseudarthrobacter sp. P1]|uniref:hypothetical protein n=1 Tax=Pseudarthrobacter sp. P1 TaxID=3418418 RepID=UPI003CF3496A
MGSVERVRPQQVTATALGTWPGTDAVEAARITRGELGDPHLPYLVQLPDRGVGSDDVGRTAALLVELPVDVQPFGWRLVDRPGADHRRAVSALSSDINVLADVAGAEERRGPAIKVQLCGPWTMAAAIHLHYGERALLDYGARRDLGESLAAGLGAHLARIATAVPGAAITVQIDEPEIARVLAGAIPTSSGYRTLRAIDGSEVASAWEHTVRAAREGGAAEVVFALPAAGKPVELALRAQADGLALPLRGLGTSDWEQLADAIEGGKGLWAGVVPVDDPAAAPPQVSRLVESVMRPWRGLGLAATDLAALRVTPAGGLAGYTPGTARAVLTTLTGTARALNDVMAD